MTLLINKFNYHELTRDESTGKRLYLCPDQLKVASVTTILDATKPQEKIDILNAWKARKGEKQAKEIVVEAASRGTRMHKYLEDYIKGIPLKQSVSNPYAQQSLDMAKVVVDKGFNDINEIWGSEVQLYYPGIYAGTTDLVGLHCNDEAIMDFKQTNRPKKEEWIDDYYLQLCAYALAHNKLYNTNIRKGVILMCSANYEYQQFILTHENFSYWEDKWWDRVEQYYTEN